MRPRIWRVLYDGSLVARRPRCCSFLPMLHSRLQHVAAGTFLYAVFEGHRETLWSSFSMLHG